MENGGQSKTAQYALIQGLYWMSFCMIFAYASVYLLDRGLNNTVIGLLIGISGNVSAILQPWIGGMAGDDPERTPLKRMIMLSCSLMLPVGLSLFLASGNQVLTVVCCGVGVTFLQMLTPLVHSLGMVCINRGEKLDFGLTRGIGSPAYAGISYVAGFMVASMETALILTSVAVLYGGMLAAMFTFRSGEEASGGGVFGEMSSGEMSSPGGGGTKGEGDGGSVSGMALQRERGGEGQQEVSFFKRYPRLFMFLLGAIPVFVSHNMLNNFAFQIMENKGRGSSATGTAIALAATSESPTTFLFGWVVTKMRCDVWLKISGLFLLIKTAATVLARDVTGMYLIQGLQMFGFAPFVVASVHYVNMIMKDKDRTKGQASMTITNTLGGVLGSACGGALIDGFSIHITLLVSTSVAAIGMALMSGAVKRR